MTKCIKLKKGILSFYIFYFISSAFTIYTNVIQIDMYLKIVKEGQFLNEHLSSLCRYILCVPGSLLLGLRTTTNSGESSGREATEQQWRGKVEASQTTDLKRTSRPLASGVCWLFLGSLHKLFSLRGSSSTYLDNFTLRYARKCASFTQGSSNIEYQILPRDMSPGNC